MGWSLGHGGDPERESGGPEEPPDLHFCGADDGIRTRDPHLGKVMLYQLSHVRVGRQDTKPGPTPGTVPAETFVK